MTTAEKKHERLFQRLPSLTNGQLFWLDKVVEVFECPHTFQIYESDLFNTGILADFGDALRIHHAFSVEPFSKDKFEYVLEQILKIDGRQANLATKGNRGHDITIDGVKVSLKTQADKNIRRGKIWISKFMELGSGQWSNKPEELNGLLSMFLHHMTGYDRIFTLRTLQKGPEWEYELVEIPKKLLQAAENGRLEMKLDSKQLPKPGYCYVTDLAGNDIFQLYFDGGGERKLQVKNLLKTHCTVHATWKFSITQLERSPGLHACASSQY